MIDGRCCNTLNAKYTKDWYQLLCRIKPLLKYDSRTSNKVKGPDKTLWLYITNKNITTPSWIDPALNRLILYPKTIHMAHDPHWPFENVKLDTYTTQKYHYNMLRTFIIYQEQLIYFEYYSMRKFISHPWAIMKNSLMMFKLDLKL